MKKKMGIRALAAILAASVVMSASSGAVFAKNNGANVSVTGDVSDTSAASETTTRASAKTSASNVSVEGAALKNVEAPSGLAGEGTTSSPYQIGSLSDLLLMNSYINYENSSAKEFILTKDINLSKATFSHFTDSDGIWSLVSAKPSLSGNANIHFRLNGAGHKLYGLNVSLPKNALTGAIFGFVNANSAIENLTIENCTLRVNRAADGAYAVLAVQNCGRLQDITMTDCVLDARLGAVSKRASDSGCISEVSGSRVYVGHAIGVADNAGKVLNFTVAGNDADKGVFVKGGRRFVGIVAGQNRKEISGATVSGMRILSYGSDDADTSISGKGVVAAYVGVVAGRNDKSATVSSADVTFSFGADVLFGDPVGGIVGENAGAVEGSIVRGTNVTGAAVTSASANLYGVGRYGAIAGENSGTISGCGAYDVGACFAQSDAQNAYGGIAGANTGTVSNSAATGSVNLQNSPSAGVGGLIGYVRAGTTLIGNYALVSASAQEANVGALIGRDGTTTYIGQNNYWSSQASGLMTPVPNDGAGQNDLTPAKSVIVLTESTSGLTLDASVLTWSWQGGKITAAADFTGDFSVTKPVIRLNKNANSVTLSCTKEGVVGALEYTVTAAVPAGIAGHKLSARVSIPVFVTASKMKGAGSTVKNPIVITDAQQMQILQYEPNAHYSLEADITLGSDWTPVDFGGTFNGNGHTVRISTPIFSSVTGSRDGSVSSSDWKSAGNNLISGYIYDMTIVPTTCVFGGVFGDVKNATLRDVTYTVNDENDGFVALSAPKSGALIDTLTGNAFLYRCKVSVPIAVTAENAEGIGALVGYAAPANLVAESCETSSLISLEKNTANVGGLFGKIDGRADLTDCSATGCVYVPSIVNEVRANIMIGAASSGVTASGCTYAMTIGVSGGSVAKKAAPFTEGITELNPQSDAAKQGAEDARSMLSLIDPEMIEEEPLNGALVKEGGVYKLRTAADVQEMQTMLNSGDFTDTYHTSTYELQNDINMGGIELKMATTADTAFAGIFRSTTGNKYTLSNFTVTNLGSDATDTDSYPESVYYTATALFCYATEATFQNFAIENVTVVNDGVGTAVLVGFADKDGDFDDMGAYSDCTFKNIDISGCNVYSAYSVNGTGYSAENAALAGTLIGGVWSMNGGDQYTIQNITVTDCVVENRNWDSTWTYYSDCAEHTGGGSWAIGGLIGGSRLSDGTLCIGDETANAASVTLQHVTVTGFGAVGGVIGMAGTSSSIAGSTSSVLSSQRAAGGLKIDRVAVTGKVSGNTVERSSVTAGSGTGIGGSCGGILGIEVVLTNANSYATISHCDVSDTDVFSDNDTTGTSLQNYFYTDCGGIAGHMSGKVEYCNVTDSTVKSTTPGGIVGRASRKATNHASTHVQIDHCYVLGDTTIGFVGASGSSNNSGEGGGIISSARYASVTITNCGIGSNAKISSNHFKYAGGFIGYTNSGSNAYAVVVRNSVMAGTVEIPPLTDTEGASSVTDSAVGGAVGYAGMFHYNSNPAKLYIDNCVVGGTVKITNYYAGGVIGWLRSYTTNQSNTRAFQIENCTVSTYLDSATQYRAKLIGFSESPPVNQSNRWAYLNNLKLAIKTTIFSSYPQNLDALGYCKPTSGTYSGQTVLMGTYLSHMSTSSLISAGGMIEDINKPNGGTDYLNGETAAYVISGTRSATISVTNTTSSTLVAFDDSDGASPNDEKKYGGWVSANQNCEQVNNNLEVADTTDATTIDLAIKHDASNVGVMAYYTVTGKTDPETGDPMQIAVWIPLTLSQIPAAAIGGDGSQGSPWEIPDRDTLESLVNRDLSAGKYYIITADIDCSSSPFTPINVPFCATLYGNNKTISGLRINGTASTGIFEETNGATIQDLTISGATVTGTGLNVVEEDLNANPPVQGSVTGQYASALVGKANATTFQNITVTGSTVGGTSNEYPSAYAGAIAAYATDCTAEKITLSNDTVRYAYFTGGVFGHAHYTGTNVNKPSQILGTTVTGLTVASSTLNTTTNYDGVNSGKVDAAGGIVAEFAGTIGDYTSSGTTTHTTLSTLAESGNDPAVTVSVTGSNAGGVVGIADQTRTDAASACAISNVTVGTGTTVTSSRVLLNKAAAGGIIGKICPADPAYDDVNEATLETDPAIPVTITGCAVSEGVTISAKHFAGGILGHSGVNGSTSKITITSCETFAAVSADQSGSAVGAIAGRIFDLANIDFSYCVASGTLSAMSNGGGIIGLVPADYDDIQVPGVYSTSRALISNSVYSATLTVTGTGGQRGVLIGSVPTSVLPTSGLTGTPFVNIYYSSYQVPADLRTKSGGVIKVKISGANDYINFQNTVIDLMTDFAFTQNGTDYSSQLRVPLAGTVISPNRSSEGNPVANSIRLWSNVTSGNYLSFVCPSNVTFVLDTITSDPDLVTFNRTTGKLTPRSGANDTGDAIFTYTNGIQLNLDLIASDIKGAGTSNDPFLIERIGHLNAVKTMPNANYVLAADLDFSSTATTTAHNDPLTAEERAWASNWEAWAKDLMRTDTESYTDNGVTKYRYIYRFTGNFDGEWYPYTGDAANYGYDHNQAKKQHTISNLTVVNDGSYTQTKDGVTQTVSVGYYGAGLFPVIEVGASVSNVTFSGCSFSSAPANNTNKMNNVGVLCGENYGTISGITISGCTVSSVSTYKSGNNEYQTNHVGAVAGISYKPVSGCTVTNSTVSSSHCAGGVVGGGQGVSNSTVTGTTVTGREYAGGVVGGNLNYINDGNHEVEVPQNSTSHASTGDLRLDMLTCTFENCHVLSCTIQSDTDYAKDSSVGGILGIAESGDQWNDRSVSFVNCTVDCQVNTHKQSSATQTTVTANAIQGIASQQQNFAGGILGNVVDYYNGLVVENCASYAIVYASGRYANGEDKPSAAALVGRVAENSHYKAYEDNTLKFRFINNVAGGKVRSSYLAGGICGYFAPGSTGYEIPENADFLCGNIISCSFERLPETNTGSTTDGNKGFGILIGTCTYSSFESGKALSTMKQNYYSSYVSKDGNFTIPAFSLPRSEQEEGTVPVVTAGTDFTGLYNVAKYGAYKSSFLVINKVYYQPEGTTAWKLKNSEQGLEDSVTAPVITYNKEQIYPGHPVDTANPDNPPANNPNNPDNYNMDMQLMFDMGATTSGNFANPATTLTVYTTGIASAYQHTLSLTDSTDIFVTPDNGTTDFYGGARTVVDGESKANLTVRNDPELCADTYDLIADLDYGLLVGITIMTNVGTGEIDNPWKIPDGATFAHFFFSRQRVEDTNREYLSDYYAQTGDFSWNDVLLTLSGDPDKAYQTGETYGYMNGSTFVEFKNSALEYVPIGSYANPFTGGYDGGWNYDSTEGRFRSDGAGNTISDFHYTAPAGTVDVGLFGYVSGDGEHHFKNIHIELSETALDSVNETTDGTAAGVFGGTYTGALCGRYVSKYKIDNCSVVYGTVRSDVIDACVGGLIGKMSGSATMQNCFTSCNVRARADDNVGDKERYICGGLIGLQEGSATQLSAAGTYPCNYINCFSSSDVVGSYYVGGFVGEVGSNTFVNLTNCASTATVTGINLFTDKTNQLGPTLVIGRRPSEGLLNSAYQENESATPKYVTANNVYVAGMNTTEFRFRDTDGKQIYPTMFGIRALRDESSGVYYDASTIGRITVPNGSSTPDMIKVNGDLCNGYAIKQNRTAPFTALKTAELTAEGVSLGTGFDTTDASLYPVLKMAERAYASAEETAESVGEGSGEGTGEGIGEGTGEGTGEGSSDSSGDSSGTSAPSLNDPDPYFTVFAQLSAMPMFTDDRELDDVTADRTYVGVTYPTRVSKLLGETAVTIESSKFTADSNTPKYTEYPSGSAMNSYDYLLEGNNHRNDMDTDLLFNRGAGSTDYDSANTTEYGRTDTRTDYLILRNTDLAYNSSATALSLSQTRNERSPFVRITIGSVHRTMRVGLRSSGNTSYVSTERQLRAITSPEASGKFHTAYASTLSGNHNIRLCADIDFNPKTEKRSEFTPIGLNETYNGSSTGDGDEGAFGFDGSNCEIRNIFIGNNQYSGLFSKINYDSSNAPKIQNLVLRNPTVSGTIAVGALAGQIDRANAQIINCSVIGGTITATTHSSSIGGLVGVYANHGGSTPNAKAQWAGVIGVKIVTLPSVDNPVTNAGLMFGSSSGAMISDSYAVGELKDVYARNVGGLSGSAVNTTASGIVTSGYVSSAYSNSNSLQTANYGAVGGIFGKMATNSIVNNAITTAYVSGQDYYADIVGITNGGLITNTIFAGSTSGEVGDPTEFFTVGHSAERNEEPAVSEVCYDRSLQFTELNADYNPLTTWQIVSGSGTGNVFNDNSNPDSFQYDKTSYRYYPNPIDMRGYKAPYGQISNVISDSFKTGLGFALARINTAYGGTGGSVSEYDQISVTSPIGAIGSKTANGQPDGNLTNEMTVAVPKADDTVALAEYTVGNADIGSGTYYLTATDNVLVPHLFDDAAYTGVRATMNTTTGDPTFTQATLYRFLVVDLCRIVEFEYTVTYDGTAAKFDVSTETDKLVLMLKMQQKLKTLYKNATDTQGNNAPLLTFSSNAVTSKFQDSDENSGTYTVKYRKICVPSDNHIYVGAMLPSQYKISDVKAYDYDFTNNSYKSTDIYDSTNKYIVIPTGEGLLADAKVKIDVTVSADPSWGLRDLDGGIG